VECDDERRSAIDRDRLARDDVSAVILAGGHSSRRGRPKAWLPVDGVPMLVRVAERVRPLVREIVVVAAAEQALPPLEARILRDPTPDLGPLPALALGLGSITTPWAFALGCDSAFVTRAVLELLTREAAGADAAIPVWDEQEQPLVAIYHRRFAGHVGALSASGERRLQAVARAPGVRLVSTERLRACDPSGASFRSMNTPAEYAAALADAGHTPEDD
jgi:molybdopterin-guanine dinucleotide biosynthesis protein A